MNVIGNVVDIRASSAPTTHLMFSVNWISDVPDQGQVVLEISFADSKNANTLSAAIVTAIASAIPGATVNDITLI